MRKTLKIFLFFICAFIIFSIGYIVEANSIQSISMDIFVDDNGDAFVTEIWKCNVIRGTEVYHPYYNLGNSTIKDLKVIDGNNKYTTLANWNGSGTLESKANKCGINKTLEGVELCWGISQYGTHTYTVQYTITNFVSETQDAQMIYWTLIPHNFSTTIGEIYIKIHTDFKIQDTIDVWGYGNYAGTAYVYNGYIEMQSNGRLDADEYMTILVKFPQGTFNTSNILGNNFQYYYNMAEEGSRKYQGEMFALVVNVVVFLGYILVILTMWNRVKSNVKLSVFDYGTDGKKIPKDVPYYRDIPCRKDLFRAYYIGFRYGIIKNKTDILGAIILKWLKDNIIRIEQKETGLIFKKENTVIVLNEMNPDLFLDDKEKELFEMLYSASKDGYLESKEFEKWCQYSYSKILMWFDTIIVAAEEKLKEQGLIKNKKSGRIKISKKDICVATSELKQEAIELAGLKRYLNEYTLIKEREAIEVVLFEEYLIFAQIMGIAKKVAKQFNDIYPEIIGQSSYNSYDNIIYIHTSSQSGIATAQTAKARAARYSSGGGGFSSGGGGGGSFGGGSGGRRI